MITTTTTTTTIIIIIKIYIIITCIPLLSAVIKLLGLHIDFSLSWSTHIEINGSLLVHF